MRTYFLLAALGTIVLSVALLNGGGTNSDRVHAAQNQQPTTDVKQFSQEEALAELRKRIAGQEDKPAEAVFKNIQILKGVPARRVLGIMAMGYSKSLGVTCTHCHTPGQWEKDDLPTKQITREMAMMTRAIKTEYLDKIKGLASPSPVVNCTTCHRGQRKPALDLP